MAQVLEKLLYVVEGDTKKMRTELKKAEGVAKRSGDNMGRSFAGLNNRIRAGEAAMTGFRFSMAAAAGIAGVGALVKSQILAADLIGKTADAIGIGTDALQEYRHAASLAGVEQGKLDGALKKATKNIGELEKSSSELETTLGDLAPALLEDMRAVDSVEAALALAFRAMAEMEDQTRRAAVAAALFGRAGIDMTLIVRNGSKAFDETREAAHRLGLVLDEALIRKAEVINDKWTIFTDGLAVKFQDFVLRSVSGWQFLLDALENGLPGAVLSDVERLAADADRLADAFRELVEVRARLAAGGQSMGEEMADLDSEFTLSAEVRKLATAQGLGRGQRPPAAFAPSSSSPAEDAPPARGADVTTSKSKLPGASATARLVPPELGLTPIVREINRELGRLYAERIAAEKKLDEEAAADRLEQFDAAIKAEEAAAVARLAALDHLHAEELRGDEFVFSQQELMAREADRRRKEIDELVEAGVVTEREAAKAKLAISVEYNDKVIDLERERTEELASSIEDSYRRMDDVLVDSLSRGKFQWRDFARVAIESVADIARSWLRVSAGPSATATTGSLVGSIASSLFGFQHGGKVKGGAAIIVGEAGEEVFIPPSDGEIIPNHKLRGFTGGGAGAARDRFDHAAPHAVHLDADVDPALAGFMGITAPPGSGLMFAIARALGRFGVVGSPKGKPMGKLPGMDMAASDLVRDGWDNAKADAAAMGKAADSAVAAGQGRLARHGNLESLGFSTNDQNRAGGGGMFSGHNAPAGPIGHGAGGVDRATGGKLLRGQVANVGEAGIEVFAPRVPALGGGGGGGSAASMTIVQHFDFTGASLEAEAKLRNTADAIKRDTLAAVQASSALGGEFARMRRV